MAEQVADHLRKELLRGTWSGLMPGSGRLAEDLGVGHGTIDAALDLLEKEGLLIPQGVGRRRRIERSAGHPPPSLRLRILLYQGSDRQLHYMVDLVHELREAGHAADFSGKSLMDLKMDPERVRRHIERGEADAWIVGSGSRPVLEWFARQQIPVFALAGRRRGLPIAGGGPEKITAQRELVRRLVELGHRRIVMLAREERRKPRAATFEQAFLDELRRHGIATGPFNLPDWDERPGGFQRCLTSLFARTPPTALFVEEMPLFVAAMHHLASCGIAAPRDVSLICGEPDLAFEECLPSITHIHWDAKRLVRRIVKWADNVARGKEGRRQTSIKATLVEAGTIGPASQ